MLLAIDVGNTQTVIGLFDGDELVTSWRIATDATATSDEIRIKLGGLFALNGWREAEVDAVGLASVVPPLTEAWTAVAGSAWGVDPVVIGPGVRTGLDIAVDDPSEVGADRIANAIAAIERFGAPVLVVDFGTATTIDVIDGRSRYRGGTISPGVETSADALFAQAARLYKVDLDTPGHTIGTNTRDSIQAGVILGEAARIDGLVDRIVAELGEEPRVVATGGLAARVASVSRTIEEVDESLTLLGIRSIHRMNRRQ